jgi:DNA replicative helicase MCM subunit Mcm2 (Cdc46/Mcm family)
MVNKEAWDSDERNNQNDLAIFLSRWSRHEETLLKGIKSKKVAFYLSLEEQDFRKHLKDSLTLAELKRLSEEEVKFRDKLIENTMSVWRRHKEELKEGKKEMEQEIDYYQQKDDELWTPKHHESQTVDYDHDKIYSVSDASRLHQGKGVSVIGSISGVQPLRKMVKGVQVGCLKCNTVYERKYSKPEFFESASVFDRIHKCIQCKTGKFLQLPTKENINAVVVELKDSDTFSEIDPLRIIVFGDDEPAFDNTRGIEKHVGETIIVTGDIYPVDISRRKREGRIVSYLYVTHLVNYLSKQDVELTAEDVKAVKRFVKYIGEDKIIDKLADMFAMSVIGYRHVKTGILLVAASTSLDKTMKKINAMLVGDPGLAKSLILKESVKLVSNSTYESVQFATGKSLTAIVTNDEGDAHILRIGPIPQAKGAIAALNEMNRMMEGDQGLILDTMQEQEFTTAKYGLRFHVDAQTAIIGSANPIGGAWKDGKIDLDKIAMIKPLLDRFDLIFTFKDNRDEVYNMDYARQKAEMENRSKPDYTSYLVKHIMVAKQRCVKPRFSEEATEMLNQYYVEVRKRFGSPRIRETIFRIAQNMARLKLKNTVDEVDARHTMEYYNHILLELETVVPIVSRNPKEETYEQCLDILMGLVSAIAFEELIRMACDRNMQVARYIGKTFKLEYNIKLRSVLEMLLNHSHVKQVQMKPYVLQYIHRNVDNNETPGIGLEEYNITISHLSDTSDTSDIVLETSAKNESEKNIPLQKKIFGTFAESSKRVSDISDTSDSSRILPEQSFSSVMIPKSLYKLKGSKGVWKCHDCFKNGDLQSMIDHVEHCSHDKDLI